MGLQHIFGHDPENRFKTSHCSRDYVNRSAGSIARCRSDEAASLKKNLLMSRAEGYSNVDANLLITVVKLNDAQVKSDFAALAHRPGNPCTEGTWCDVFVL